MTTPTILEMAARIARRPGIDGPTPRWHATLAYLYGLPLTDIDVDQLAAATHRNRASIIAHARQTFGRRRFRQLWARIGRRGRKSATAALIAVYEALYGGHEGHVMPGEQALAAVISKDLAGANVVSRFVKLYLDALGFKVTTTKIGAVSLVEIEGCAVAIATLAATSEAPRGFAICCLVLDEFAHVATSDDYTDTDKSILAGALPAMAQFPNALTIGISTGLGRDGVHYERVERGLGNDDEHEILAVTGASWEWSEDITETEAARIADDDDDVMLTEFRGGVSELESLWMPQADAAAMFEPRSTEGYLWGKPFALVDFAESADTLAYCFAAWGQPDGITRHKRLIPPASSGLSPDTFIGYELDRYGCQIPLPKPDRPLLWIFHVAGIEGEDVRRMGMESVIAQLADECTRAGAKQIIGDDRGGPYVEALFSKYASRGLRYSFVHYANKKHDAVLLCRSWARDRNIYITEHAEMRKQCLRYRRFIRGATYTYGKAGQRDDFVCLPVTLAVSLIRRSEEQSHTTAQIDGAPTTRFLGGRHVTGGR